MNIGIYYDHPTAWWQEQAGDSAPIFRVVERLAAMGDHQFIILSDHPAPDSSAPGLAFRRPESTSAVELMWYLQPPGLSPEIMHVSTMRESQIRPGKARSGIWNPEGREEEIMLQRAAWVLTDTEAGREAIVREYLVPTERIGVLPFRGDMEREEAELTRLFNELERYRRCWP